MLNEGTLYRVIVNEDEAVGADVDLLGGIRDIDVLVVPVGLDDEEVVLLQCGVGSCKACQRILLVVLGCDGKKDSQVLMGLNVLLELCKELGFGVLVADLDVLRTVVTDDAAPERVVHIKGKCLLILAVNSLDDVREIERKIRDRGNAQSVLISVPVTRICPLLDAVDSGNVVDVVNEEIPVALGISAESVIQAVDEVQSSVDIRKVAVAKEPVERLLEVILDNGALIALGKCSPDLLEPAHGLFDKGVDLFGGIRNRRELCDISCCCVHENKVRSKFVQFGIAEDGILKILVVLGLEELGLDAVVQKEEL